jgi:hypothetical protein
MSIEHPQTFVHVDDQAAWVDEGLAGFIELLWRHGWQTDNSCQDNGGLVWISFPAMVDAEDFLSMVAGEEADDDWSLYRAIVQSSDPADPQLADRLRREHLWRYAVLPKDLNELVGGRTGAAEVRFSLSVRFPPGHLPEVMERLEDHLAATDT